MLNTASETLRANVIDELESDPRVDAKRIAVAVDDDAVRLTGTVSTFQQKWAAEEAAKRVKGVRAVAQEITVDLPSAHQRGDMDIARAITDAFYWDVSIPQTVQATVQKGEVTLTGEADWNYQRDEAAAVARRILGVRGVKSFISLKKAVAEKDIRDEIQRIFHRDAQMDANKVHIACEGGKVTLSGTVRSWLEHDEAARAAFSVKGVIALDNRISVVPS